jgi:hypothetical protein
MMYFQTMSKLSRAEQSLTQIGPANNIVSLTMLLILPLSIYTFYSRGPGIAEL